jgi:hypothetical protein
MSAMRDSLIAVGSGAALISPFSVHAGLDFHLSFTHAVGRVSGTVTQHEGITS